MRTFTDEGVIIKRNNTGEADRIVTIFTKYHGRLRLIAKGVRRITSRRSGQLEQFNLVKVSVASGRTFGIITEAIPVNNFLARKTDLERILAAYQCAELVERLTPEGEENEMIFRLLIKTLENLTGKVSDRSAVKDFAVQLLVILGFWPAGKPVSGDWQPLVESIIERPLKTSSLLTKQGGSL
jgi:DNA repair protein RecO (recombination protein O)